MYFCEVKKKPPLGGECVLLSRIESDIRDLQKSPSIKLLARNIGARSRLGLGLSSHYAQTTLKKDVFPLHIDLF